MSCSNLNVMINECQQLVPATKTSWNELGGFRLELLVGAWAGKSTPCLMAQVLKRPIHDGKRRFGTNKRSQTWRTLRQTAQVGTNGISCFGRLSCLGGWVLAESLLVLTFRILRSPFHRTSVWKPKHKHRGP